MIHLHDVVELWSEWLIHSGWQAAVVVAAAAVLLQLGRRRSAQFRYAILVIALAKFAAPPFLSLPVGLFSHTRMPVEMVANVTVVGSEVSSVGGESIGRLPTDLPDNHSIASTLPANRSVPSGMPEPLRVREPSVVDKAMFPWLAFILLCIHGMGILLATYFVWRQYRSIQNLIKSSTPASEEILQLARSTAFRLGVRKIPNIVISNESDAPFATGMLKQIILLPHSTLELPEDQLRIIIGHELVHIRRRDLAMGWVETGLRVVWWFHPGMWWLNRALRRTREDCCDDVVLATHLAEPERYCETLIQAAAQQTFLAPEPVALGFSNGEHPAARRIRRLMDSSLFRTQHLKKTALLLAAILGLLVLPGMQPLKAPIVETSLQGLFGWRNLSFDPDADELAVIKQCHQAVGQYRSTYGNAGQRRFDDLETRDNLEAILKRKPNYFYVQHLLGTWYRRNGDLPKARELLTASLRNAPIVLTQRYRLGNGKPLTNVTIETMEIECNRVKNHSINQALKLEFVDLVTDSNGEVAVPVYDTVFRLFSRTFPSGYDTESARLGFFQSKSRYGVLPEIIAWKRHSQPGDFQRTVPESPELAGAIGTTTDTVTSGSNRYQVGRVSRCQADGNFIQRQTSMKSDLPELPRITNAAHMDHAIIDLSSPLADLFELRRVAVLDSKTKIPLHSFQLAAGVKVFDKTRFHLYSIANKLPDEVDLVMTVVNLDADDLRMIIPAEAKGVYKSDNVTFVNDYLGAGEHPGWSSKDGFYKEASALDFVSEMLFRIDAANGKRFSLILVTTDGQRIDLGTSSPLLRIPKPLTEIDHFELMPAKTPQTIYFEKIKLPPRTEPISSDTPEARFQLNGQTQTVSTDLFYPIVLRCKPFAQSFSGCFGGQFGYGFHEKPSNEQDPGTKSTVVVEAFAEPGIKLSSPACFLQNSGELKSEGGSAMSGAWGAVASTRLPVPVTKVSSVVVRVVLDRPEK